MAQVDPQRHRLCRTTALADRTATAMNPFYERHRPIGRGTKQRAPTERRVWLPDRRRRDVERRSRARRTVQMT
jgi:hypothetical protein